MLTVLGHSEKELEEVKKGLKFWGGKYKCWFLSNCCNCNTVKWMENSK